MSPEYNDHKADEFDIEALAEKLYRIAVRGFNKLLLPIRWMIARPIVFTLLISAAVGLAYIGTKVLPKSYEASFIIKPYNGGNLIFINMLRDLEGLAEENDYRQLAAELQIEEETAQRIRSISSEIVWKNPSDTVGLAIISLRSVQPDDFDTLQHAVITYLESNPFYVKTFRTWTERTKSFTNRLEAEISELDSLKEFITSQTLPGNTTRIIYGESPDLVKVYETILGLYGRQLDLSAELKRQGNFELIKPCVVHSKPVFPRFGYLLLVLLPLAFIAAMIIGYRAYKR